LPPQIRQIVNFGAVPSPGNMNVRLAAIDIGEAGRCWISENLANQRVHLRLIQRDTDGDAVQAEMIAKPVRDNI
jgi:hypothetical protein